MNAQPIPLKHIAEAFDDPTAIDPVFFDDVEGTDEFAPTWGQVAFATLLAASFVSFLSYLSVAM